MFCLESTPSSLSSGLKRTIFWATKTNAKTEQKDVLVLRIQFGNILTYE